ncbi:MAG: exopolysaccharide Pel transporter PelG [Magnetococcales bacterium]|nr:exopolysaccharide Pel transporter PelG [Magnetococcales bacterium]
MAGIGFVLRRLTYQDNLLGLLAGFGYSSLVATGPWIFTILVLSGSGAVMALFTNPDEQLVFQSIVIYNFSFSLVLTGPLNLVITRYVADMIYRKDIREVPGTLMGGGILLNLINFPLALYYYLAWVEAPLTLRIFGVINYTIISNIWLATVFVTALKAYELVIRIFVLGMGLGFVANILLSLQFGIHGMLFGFNIGLSVILFALYGRIFAEYPHDVRNLFGFIAYFRTYWDLALSGFLINAAAWMDKWIMWLSPDKVVIAKGFISCPMYDSAMFTAYLTIVPSMATFLMNMETEFYERYLNFYRNVSRHVTLDVLRKAHRRMVECLHTSGRNYMIFQGSISITAILLAPKLFELLSLDFQTIGIFRLGVLGAFFHILVQFLIIVLSYFDLRRMILLVSAFFLLTNGWFNWHYMQFGFAYYGYGYFLASLVSFVLAYLITFRKVEDLIYQTFVVSNASVNRE